MRAIKKKKGETKIISFGLISIISGVPLNVTKQELKEMIQDQVRGHRDPKEIQDILAELKNSTHTAICKKYKIPKDTLGSWQAVFGKGISFTRIDISPWQNEIKELEQVVTIQQSTIDTQNKTIASQSDRIDKLYERLSKYQVGEPITHQTPALP